jgi:hypothetical protein
MKKTFILSMIVSICICGVAFAQKTLTFQWEHSEAVVGDKFEIHYSSVSGQDYQLLTSITIEEATTTYTQTVQDITIPVTGAYFVCRYIRTSDGDISGWSNEVFWKGALAPYKLKLILE